MSGSSGEGQQELVEKENAVDIVTKTDTGGSPGPRFDRPWSPGLGRTQAMLTRASFRRRGLHPQLNISKVPPPQVRTRTPTPHPTT